MHNFTPAKIERFNGKHFIRCASKACVNSLQHPNTQHSNTPNPNIDGINNIIHTVGNITATLSTLWVSRNLGGFSLPATFQAPACTVGKCR
ncbi:MAG: hypothetical protein ACI8VC_000391 [Candidatus Endobugula sp.]|jgi:hypothetical protein